MRPVRLDTAVRLPALQGPVPGAAVPPVTSPGLGLLAAQACSASSWGAPGAQAMPGGWEGSPVHLHWLLRT